MNLQDLLHLNLSAKNVLLSLHMAAWVFAIVCGAQRWKSIDPPGKILCIILLLTFVNEVYRQAIVQKYQTMIDLQPWLKKEISDRATPLNKFLLSLGWILEMTGFGMLAFATISNRNLFRKSILLFIVVLIIILINRLFLQQRMPLYASGFMITCLISSCFAIWVLYRLAVATDTDLLSKVPAFWFWSVILISSCCTLAFWGLLPLLGAPYPNPVSRQEIIANQQMQETAALIYHIHAILNILQYLALGSGYFVYRTNKSHGS